MLGMDILILSMQLPCYKHIKSYGAESTLKSIYKSHFVSKVEDGYDVTLYIPLDVENIKSYISSKYDVELSRIKNHSIGGVYKEYFTALKDNKSLDKNLTYNLHDDCTIYIIPKSDRVTIIFELNFTDKVDRAIGKVFLQEFIESKRRIGAAPPCTYSMNTLLEMQQAFNIPAGM